ncbi:DUF4124 domain-containing protein [Thalassotalea agarivorans]|uniref:DUF4124 domain-containing protein n=1 Tax=Thalassotalea agarivorans TaxID=349064 RepID=A0A1I0F4S4_THASX|nr:DUF4124 domain-containing protein [Thalassotalea agarivorans]SET52408.1 protein of unknown function [Thalassotalea agarivorans]
MDIYKVVGMVAILVSSGAYAENEQTTVYKCVKQGVTAYSDIPCAKDAQQIVYSTKSSAVSSVSTSEDNQQTLADTQAKVAERKKARETDKINKKIVRLQQQMQQELADLDNTTNFAIERRNGKSYDDIIAKRQKEVRKKYERLIQQQRKQLENIQ